MTHASALAAARSFLFVPANRPERFEKAARSGADAVILDLEDSVPADQKPEARRMLVAQWDALQKLAVPVLVRINAEDSSAWSDDLDLVESLPGLTGLLVPKAQSPDTLLHVHERLRGMPLVPLVETAEGLDAVKALATTKGVLRLAVGHIDFMADMGMTCDQQESELVPMRFAVASATRLARLAPAIDGVTVQIQDHERLRNDTIRARAFGYGAKLCIHPRQVAIVHEALGPSAQELDWARRVVAADAASAGAAVQLDGRMIDLPVVLLARRTLARAEERHRSSEGESR